MSDPTPIDQLSRQLVDILGNPHSTDLLSAGQYLTQFWVADACWIWPLRAPAVICNDRSDLSAAQVHSCLQTAPAGELLVVEGYQILWFTGGLGQLAIARRQNWITIDQEHFKEISPLLIAILNQAHLQQQTEITKQSMRHIQGIADKRTAQLRSSQNLLSKLQEANRRRIRQLDESNRVKDEFISTISHELRTPLTSMSLAIRMLRQPNLDEPRRTKYLDIIEEQCTQEINLINDLLTLQQLESKQLEFDRQSVNLSELVQPLLQQFEATWASKQLQLQVELPTTWNWPTEPESISRILQELLNNAGKFAEPQTTVTFQATIGDQLALRVINQGQIITPEEQKYIFSKFRRGQGVTQQAISGTGLGLALVKSLVQYLQGEINVSSQPLPAPTASDQSTVGQAVTCFEVLLPLGES